MVCSEGKRSMLQTRGMIYVGAYFFRLLGSLAVFSQLCSSKRKLHMLLNQPESKRWLEQHSFCITPNNISSYDIPYS